MKNNKSKVMVAVVLAVGLVGGYALRMAHADGIPDANTFVYAGTVENSDGSALTGAHDLKVEVYAGATGGTALCSGEVKGQTVVNGAFEVGLPQNCVSGVQANKNVHVQVTVDGKALPRSKVGAVPYAVEAGRAQDATEANHALQADHATNAANATGALKTALDGKAAVASVPKITVWETFSLVARAGGVVFAPQVFAARKRRVGDTMEISVKMLIPDSAPAGILEVTGFGEDPSAELRCGAASVWSSGSFTNGYAFLLGSSIQIATTAASGTNTSALKGKTVEFICDIPVDGWTVTTP